MADELRDGRSAHLAIPMRAPTIYAVPAGVMDLEALRRNSGAAGRDRFRLLSRQVHLQVQLGRSKVAYAISASAMFALPRHRLVDLLTGKSRARWLTHSLTTGACLITTGGGGKGARYARIRKVGPQFWSGRTGRALKAKGTEAVIVAMYLMTCQHANMLGLYHLNPAYITADTGLPLEGALKGLRSACEAGFCRFDEDSMVVWVIEMARYQVAAQLEPRTTAARASSAV